MRRRRTGRSESHGSLLRRLADCWLHSYVDRLATGAYGLWQVVTVFLVDELRSGFYRASVNGGVPRAQAFGRRGAEGEVPCH